MAMSSTFQLGLRNRGLGMWLSMGGCSQALGTTIGPQAGGPGESLG